MKTTEYIIIRDFRAPELDLYARLSETELLRLHEPERGVFIAESPKVIERALQAGCVPISVLCEERHAEEAGMLLWLLYKSDAAEQEGRVRVGGGAVAQQVKQW